MSKNRTLLRFDENMSILASNCPNYHEKRKEISGNSRNSMPKLKSVR